MQKKGGGGKKKRGGGWSPPLNPKKTIKPLKFIKETTLKMNWRNPKKADYQCASYLRRTDVRTDGRTEGHTIFDGYAITIN